MDKFVVKLSKDEVQKRNANQKGGNRMKQSKIHQLKVCCFSNFITAVFITIFVIAGCRQLGSTSAGKTC